MPPRKFLLPSIAEIVVAVPMSMMMSGARVVVDRSNRISDPVASKLCRIVEHDLQAGTDPRSDDHDRFAGQTSHSRLHRYV